MVLIDKCSAVDQFKKQFAYLEEHYGKGGTVAPPERQHASLPRYTLNSASQYSFLLFLASCFSLLVITKIVFSC